MARRTYTETEVASAVMEYLAADGWECYPEVELYGGRADIVAVRPMPFGSGRVVWIVETKTSWSMSLLEQAIERCRVAHYVSIAAPKTRQENGLVRRICRDYGIGTMQLSGPDLHVEDYRSRAPRLVRGLKAARESGFGPWYTLERLHEDQKRFTPGGTSASGYSTEFGRTMDRCAEYVRENPGCTVQDIVAVVDGHYRSSASYRQGVLSWLHRRYDDIEARKEGRCIRYYPLGAPSIAPELPLGAEGQLQ